MSGDRGWLASGVDSGPLVRVRLTLSRALWRIGPAWAVLAGAFAFGWTPHDAGVILRLVAAVALGDLAWGSLRQIPAGSSAAASPELATSSAGILPYFHPEAPLARFLGRLEEGLGWPANEAWRPLAVSLLLIIALSLLLGPIALTLSAGVLFLALLVWLLVVNRGSYPALSFALFDVTAPWLLGMSWGGLDAWASRNALGPLALMIGFTLLQWGIYRTRQRPVGASVAWIWIGEAAVLLALIAMRQAGACAIVAALFAPPSWWLLRRDRDGLIRAHPWWWASLMVAALASAQIIYALE